MNSHVQIPKSILKNFVHKSQVKSQDAASKHRGRLYIRTKRQSPHAMACNNKKKQYSKATQLRGSFHGFFNEQ
jgi:hypothetical protein